MTWRITGNDGSNGPSRTDVECARTYGVEARQHHFDRDWTEVQASLAAGWTRVRENPATDWSAVEPDVHAGWESAFPPEH